MQQANSITLIKRGEVDVLHIENSHAVAQVALFGAHVLSFVPKSDSRERLWVSEKAIFDNRKPIRGGIPVCWPWFGDAHNQSRQDLPSHGFVRTQIWDLIEYQENSDSTILHLSPTTPNGPGWDHKSHLKISIEIGKTLKISLQTTNLDKPKDHGQPSKSKDHGQPLNCALHSYFAVENIEKVILQGLTGEYLDKTQNWKRLITSNPYIFCQEVDRIHLFTSPKVTISDSFKTNVYSKGHDSIVVWNPWMQKSQNMTDMHDNGYQNMVCVETAITQTRRLLPGESLVLTQEIE